jgi:hypothetical protein
MDYGIRQLENAILFSFSSPHYILRGEIDFRPAESINSSRTKKEQNHRNRTHLPIFQSQ